MKLIIKASCILIETRRSWNGYTGDKEGDFRKQNSVRY